MNWQHFQTYNEAPTRAFESMCNQLFELWCKKTYQDSVKAVTIVNGSGGDGGVEAFATKKDDTIIGIQAKWFLGSISTNQFGQIYNSIETALKVRPMIKQYIVCIPRDLASTRVGKGKKVIEDTELNRWQQLKNKLEEKYIGLTIDLWNETQILSILQEGDAAGIYRYWFEKSEISIELIAYSYEKQKSGWLLQKYTPSLHIQGQMQKRILKFIGRLDDRKNSMATLFALGQQCRKFLKACDDYLQFDQDHSSQEQEQLIDEINEIKQKVIKLLGEIELSIEAVNEELNVPTSIHEENWYIYFDRLLELLKQNEMGNKSYFHISEIKKSAEVLQAIEIPTIISDIRFQLNNKKILVLGNPGSGKTHGIANLAELLLIENLHIPILIRAKDINPQNNWLDILKQSLGMAGIWNEIELWQALEALSYRTEIHNISIADTSTVKIIPKILICIEGVDESRPYDVWYDRLREIDAICSNYPRLRFCITSRPYVFGKLPYGDSLLSNPIYLPSDGDVPVSELFPEYIQYFNVTVGRCSWIKWSLKTPLALRIFCEIYKDKKITSVEKSSITITNLLTQKFHIIEKEFNSKYETGYGDKDCIVQNSLLSMARVFLADSSVLRTDLIDSLKDVLGLIVGAHDYRRELIDFIEDYGILQSYTVNSETIFESPKTYYSIGVQPFFDYILALLITHEIHNPSEITLTEALSEQEGALQMLSILLLEDHGYLLIRNKSFRNSLNNDELFDLVCFALSNVSPGAASKYLSLVQRMLKYNSDTLRNVVNKIVLPVARIDNHPLGAQMLHKYLMGFETVGKRDILWSVPSYLSYQGDAPWKCYTKIDLIDKRYELYSEDKYNGIPLVFAWMLTTVNNVERVSYRRQLMKWASVQPLEFYKLFECTCHTNDPQMKEDLFAIAMGTVFMLSKGHPCIKLFCDLMLANVFTPDKIANHYSCAIRYYGRAIVERACALGIISDEEADKSRPPYKTNGIIPLNQEATSGTRMGGFGPIDYDLSRYVLCDPVDRLFFSRHSVDKAAEEVDYTWYFTEKEIDEILTNEAATLNEHCISKLKEILNDHKARSRHWEHFNILLHKDIDEETDYEISNPKTELPTCIYSRESDEFLLEHAKELGMESLDSNQFMLSAAYAYILQKGWNKDEFRGHPNGGKPGEVLGADVAIMRQYHAATHGSKSSIMTFCEKYIWCARNEILGYLSDRLPFSDFERAPSLLNDYGLLDDFPNPAQELNQENPDTIMEKTSWFIPEDLSPLINKNLGEGAIKDWIMNAPVPNFEKWIDMQDFNHEIVQEEKKHWISLYSFNSVSNTLGGESLMWVSSAIISKEHFKYLKNDVTRGNDFIVDALNNPEDVHSSTETQCYITPKEICWMSWKNECYNEIDAISIDVEMGDFVSYKIQKAVEECTANYPEYGDVSYKLPSRIIREMLGICDGDGYKYFNVEKHLEAFSYKAGENWNDSQLYLCVDRDKLFSELDHFNYQLVWIVRLLREPTSKSLEKYPKLRSRNDKCWLVWFEDKELETQLFSEMID